MTVLRDAFGLVGGKRSVGIEVVVWLLFTSVLGALGDSCEGGIGVGGELVVGFLLYCCAVLVVFGTLTVGAVVVVVVVVLLAVSGLSLLLFLRRSKLVKFEYLFSMCCLNAVAFLFA